MATDLKGRGERKIKPLAGAGIEKEIGGRMREIERERERLLGFHFISS